VQRKIGSFTKSMKFRMLLPVILVTLTIAAALMWYASKVYMRTIFEKEDAKVQSSFSVAGSAIREIVETSQQTASEMLLNDGVKTYAVEDFESIKERVITRMLCKEALEEMLLRMPYLHGLLYMRTDGTVFGALLRRTYFLDKENPALFSEEICALVENSSSKNIWIGPIDGEQLYQIPINNWKIPEQMILGVRRMNVIGEEPVYAIAVIDAEKFTQYLELLTDSSSRVYLTKEDGVVIAQAGTDVLLENEVWQMVSGGGSQGSDQIRLTETGEHMYVSYQRLASTGWYLIRELPMEGYERSREEMQNEVLRFSIIVLLVMLAFYIHWLHGFMQTFDWLKDGIVTLRKGKLGAQMEPAFEIEEFEIIRQEFNHMSASLARQVEITLKMEHTQLELQLRNLQTQLSPHMIFNSLTAMRWMASMAGVDQVAAMLRELSEMLRPVFRDWNNEWTIQEEISHLHHYVSLLRLRYGSQFSIEYDVADEIRSMSIPRFTIQPLIENACEHGGVQALKVSIRAWAEDGWVHFVIVDNGRGIAPDRLKEIREGIESGDMGGRIGLVNVSSRLRILSMNRSSMNVECPPEGGTVISLRWKING